MVFVEPSLKDMKRLSRRMGWRLFLRGGLAMEGSSTPPGLLFLARRVRGLGLVGEIGFNAGLSSWAMLESDPDVQVVSFDLGLHRTVPRAKQLIDEAFPGRHTLVVGDSTQAVPAYAAQNPGVRFDLVFIDGGHDYEIAAADLQNMRKLSGPNTVVVMDDVMPWRVWGQGPTKAWDEAIRSGVVVQDEVFKDGRLVDHAEAPGKRAWAVGRYL